MVLLFIVIYGLLLSFTMTDNDQGLTQVWN